MTTTELRTGQLESDTHHTRVGAAQTPSSDQIRLDTQYQCVAAGPKPLVDQTRSDNQNHRVDEAQTSPATRSDPTPKDATSPGILSSATDQALRGAQCPAVSGALSSHPAPAIDVATTKVEALVLDDGVLNLAAEVLDDLERVRIANENRLRQLTRTETDKDGEDRGFGLTVENKHVMRLAALVDALKKAETSAATNLKALMREHPLGPWVKATKGVGEQQAARLLAAIGDPYWNDLHGRPRTFSELRSYCGYGDAAAQVRKKGVKVNWNATARKRLWLIADKTIMVGGPYRAVYDTAKVHYAEAVHDRPCVRCGPAGKPAAQGSPLSAAHRHARARRASAKAILHDLWLEAKRLHELPGGQDERDTHTDTAAGSQNSSAGQPLLDAHIYGADGGPT